jgi:enoyl-CoA hydratase/carnithine racemase
VTVLLAERRDSVLTMILNRPDKHNALSVPLVDALLAEFESAHDEPTDLVVLRGDGPSFSAGFDLSGLDTLTDGDLLHRFVRIEQLLQTVHHAPFATLALAHGRVFGAGADLVCACTHRVAAPGTRFRLPGMAFGLVLGTGRLARRIGADAARTVQAGGRTLNSDEALRLGLLTAVHDRDGWAGVVEDAAHVETGLSAPARAVLHGALADDHRDVDLAALVRSAAVPGLADRIRSYVRRGTR